MEVEGKPSGLGWMPDGSLLCVSMKDHRVLRRSPAGEVTVHADVSEHCGGHLNDLVVDACGFTHPEHGPLVNQLAPALDQRGNFDAGEFETSAEGVFAAGDARIGQSLIVTAIAGGRRCARVIDRKLRSGVRES